MIQSVTFHPTQGIRIPPTILQNAGFKAKEEYIVKINAPIVTIIPRQYQIEEEENAGGVEKDWLDEALENPNGREYFRKRVKEAEREYKAGKTKPIEALFKKLKI